MPVTGSNACARRHRRPAAQPAVTRAYRAVAARHHPPPAAGRFLWGRVQAATAAGGRVGGQGFDQAVRPDQGRRPEDHQHRALAVPGRLPDLPAPVHDGRLHPAGPRARQRRGLGGDRAGRHRAARLPARRRLHARPAVRGRAGRRAARIALRPTQAPNGARPGAGPRLPAGDAVRRRAPAQLRCVRVLLALSAARRGHAACGRRARAHRRRRPDQAGPGRPRHPLYCCSDFHRRYRSTNSSRICGVRSSGASGRPG